MRALRQVFGQFVFVNKSFWRNPTAAVFTFGFPLMFLVVLTGLVGDRPFLAAGSGLRAPDYYVPAMAAFSVISACYTNLAIQVAIQRDAGILRRIRTTPLPVGVFLAGRVLHAVALSVLLVGLCAAFGWVAYGTRVPTGPPLARVAAALVVGALAFTALGLAVGALLPNADASPAIVHATILPLLFVSGVFFPPPHDTPRALALLGDFFPIKAFFDSMRAGYLDLAFRWRDVLFVGVWSLAGALVAGRALAREDLA